MIAKYVRWILVAVLLCCCWGAGAQEVAASVAEEAAVDSAGGGVEIDTIYLYSSWHAIMDHKPFRAYSGPIVWGNNALEYEVIVYDREALNAIYNQSVAMTLGDSTWLVNANWLLRNFKCEYTGFKGFMPLYFTNKIAFVQYWDDYPTDTGLRLIPGPDGNTKLEEVDIHYGDPTFYILDFGKREVREIDHDELASLLAPYPDLQRRYLGMKHGKRQDVIEFFLMKLVDALSNDPEAPELF